MIGAVAGNYRIVDKIGEGGMGAVYRGFDIMLEREVAIKVLRPELARQPDIVERFRIEAVTLAKLNHPNIATLFSFFRQGDDYFMVMEFVRGETLENRLRRVGAIDSFTAVPIFCQALEGIEHAHRMGIIHRDIKPANMMLTDNGSIKVMDFGIARVLGSARMTKQGSIIGTIEYMSPEQVLGQETDWRSDIYSLGILLYEMLTGRVPFASDSEYKTMHCQIEVPPVPPRNLTPGIPAQIDAAILKALSKNPADRFTTAAEFRNALLAGVQDAHSATLRLPPPPATAAQTPPITAAPNAPAGTGNLPETRVPPPGQRWGNLYGSQVKETRLPGPGAPMFGPELDPTAAWQGHGALPVPNQSPSIFSRLNWKHYTAGLVLLLTLLAAPFVIAVIALKPAGNTPALAPRTVQPPPSSQVSAPPSNQVAPVVPLLTPSPRLTAPNPLPHDPGVLQPDDSAAKKALSEKKEAARKQAEAAAKDRARRRAEAERALDQ